MATYYGNGSNNTLRARANGDILYGLGGNDTLASRFLGTSLFGGAGADILKLNFDKTYTAKFANNWPEWTLNGGAGADVIRANVTINDHLAIRPAVERALSYTISANGGGGNDSITINLNFDSYMASFLPDYANVPYFINKVVDLSGDNIVNIASVLHTAAGSVRLADNILTGAGSDIITTQVSLSGSTDNGYYGLTADLGDGNNVFSSQVSARQANHTLTSGNGNDTFNIETTLVAGLSEYSSQVARVNTGAGNDAITFDILGSAFDPNFPDRFVLLIFDLGEGHNSVSVTSTLGGRIVVDSGTGADRIFVEFLNVPALTGGFGGGVYVRAGDGDNVIELSAANDTTGFVGNGYAASGSGNDLISVQNLTIISVQSGAGDDVISTNAWKGTITGGAGADRFVISGVSSDARVTYPDFTLVIEDFSLAGGDIVELAGYNIPELGAAGLIDSAADLASLLTATGDVVSFVQEGADARLTLAFGAETREILFKNLTIPAGGAAVATSLASMTTADNFAGGSHKGLSLFHDRSDGADRCRFGSRSDDSTDDENHFGPGRNLAEADQLVFRIFGASRVGHEPEPANSPNGHGLDAASRWSSKFDFLDDASDNTSFGWWDILV